MSEQGARSNRTIDFTLDGRRVSLRAALVPFVDDVEDGVERGAG
jgi:hypothetical protein